MAKRKPATRAPAAQTETAEPEVDGPRMVQATVISFEGDMMHVRAPEVSPLPLQVPRVEGAGIGRVVSVQVTLKDA